MARPASWRSIGGGDLNFNWHTIFAFFLAKLSFYLHETLEHKIRQRPKTARLSVPKCLANTFEARERDSWLAAGNNGRAAESGVNVNPGRNRTTYSFSTGYDNLCLFVKRFSQSLEAKLDTWETDLKKWLGILAPELDRDDGPPCHPLDRITEIAHEPTKAWMFRAERSGRNTYGPPRYSPAQLSRVEKALANAAPDPALFSLRLSGVQEFIDQGRTTQDYWAGSYLVSYLVWKEIRSIRKLGNESIVFPHIPLTFGGEAGNIPNSVLGLLKQEDAKALLKEICIENTWNEIVGEVFDGCVVGSYPRNEWSRQADGAFEVFRGWTPWDKRESYGDWYGRLSGIMESRKSVRDFQHGMQPGVKCNLCGWRSALVGVKCPLKSHPKSRIRVRENEALCAVCFTRRAASWYLRKEKILDERLQFPSTSSIAVRPFLKAVIEKSPELSKELTDFERSLVNLTSPLPGSPLENSPYPTNWSKQNDTISKLLHYDGDWFYDTTYDPVAIKAEFGVEVDPEATRLALAKLIAAAKKLGIKRPFPYFAILICDGDEAGKWINGEKFGGVPSLLGHYAFSEAIANLTSLAAATVKNADGALVYSGGDDLLAFLPLEKLPSVMSELAANASLPVSLAGDLLPGIRFTVSIAAVAAPHNEPLAGIIRETTRLLKSEAKGRLGRAAGVIAVRRQSGQQTVAGAQWRTNAFSGLSNLAIRFANKKDKKYLSPRFIGQFAQFISPLHHTDPFEKASSNEVLQFVESLADVTNDVDLRRLSSGKPNRFLDLLLTARFLSRASATGEEEDLR